MDSIKQVQQTTIMQIFSVLPDPRSPRNQLHKLEDLIAIAIISVICGCDDWLEVSVFASSRKEWFEQFLELPNGIPSPDTFRRIFRHIDSEAFARCFIEWMNHLSKITKGKIVAVDGKVLRGSKDRKQEKQAITMVSAFATENALVLGQVATEAKSNEITAIPKLLELLDLKGAIVTIDAAGCQKKTVETICQRQADYMIGLKGNQGTLHREVSRHFDQLEAIGFHGISHDHFHLAEQSRHREEIRDVYIIDDLSWLPQRTEWKNLQSVVLVRTKRAENGETTIDRRYYLTSLSADASLAAHAIRSHWGIENQLHWILDVAFREDKSQIRKDNGAVNFSLLRRLTTNLIRKEKERNPKRKGGMVVRRKLASWDDSYLVEVLNAK